MGSWRIGVDTGGTFTDVCLLNGDTGEVQAFKVSSTPGDPSRGIANGLRHALERAGISAAELGFVGHGTTVGTNALIEGRGAPVGLITTDGFRDLLEIGRQKRPSLYDNSVSKPPVLVPRERRIGVEERVRLDGSVERKLDAGAVREAARRLRDEGVAAVAICMLYSYVNPQHEQEAVRILSEEFPDVFISASSEIAPEFREFERLSTTVTNAYLGPVMLSYLERLADRLVELGVPGACYVTQSNGGVVKLEQIGRFPVRTILSGPSTGIAAAEALSSAIGVGELITFDMGGTSTDVALLTDGKCRLVSESVVHGYPIKAPMLEINAVGAGGGSIAHVDAGGLLQVGPRSAGADPGPVCYALGNDEPTVTDANVVLGILNPTHLLAGQMPIRADLALAAMKRLSDQLGLEVYQTAQGILSVVVANIAKAIRVVCVQGGHDPRDHELLAFGGAGALHAARLARELDVRRVIVPPTPGTYCAMGLLLTDLRYQFSRTRILPLAESALEPLSQILAELSASAWEWLADAGIEPERRRIDRVVDVRYVGQNYELAVAIPPDVSGAAMLDTVLAAFEAQHRRTYGFIAEHAPIEIVTMRADAVGVVEAPAAPALPPTELQLPEPMVRRKIWLDEAKAFATAPIYWRGDLGVGHSVAGPAIIEQMDTTTFVPPGVTATIDAHLNLVLDL